MSNLVQELLSIKSPYNDFIERPELIQGYTEDEIKEIEQRYNLSIHGQFKEFLMTMGKCSGGLLLGREIFIYHSGLKPNSDSFGLENQEFWQYDDNQGFKEQTNYIDLVEYQFFEFGDDGESRNYVYFLLTKNQDDIIYQYDTMRETVVAVGTLFDFLLDWRKNYATYITGNERSGLFESLTTGRLL